MRFTDFIKSIFTRTQKDVLEERQARIKAINSLKTTKQDAIDSSHKVSADLIDDLAATHKFVPSYTVETWTFNMADGTTVTKKVIVIDD